MERTKILPAALRLAACAALGLTACGPELAPASDDPSSSAVVEAPAAPMPASLDPGLLVLAEFEGSFDGATGEFRIEQVESELAAEGLRSIQQALYCTQRVVNDGDPNSNPPDSIELYTDPASISASAIGESPHPYCVANATGGQPIMGSLFSVFGVFCADVRVSNYYASVLSEVHVAIDVISEGDEGDYAPYAEGLGTSVPAPAGLTAATVGLESIEGLWSYGNLTPRPAAGSQQSVVWAFRYARSDGFFRFRGRVVARGPAEVCGNEVDEDCDGRVNNGCSAYGVGTACLANNDCSTGYCNVGFCDGNPCEDGVQNAGETAVDCGGPICGASCAVGQACASASDCASGFCRGPSGAQTCRAFGQPTAAGDVIITEFMTSPTVSAAEWVEVYNTTGNTLDLAGCELTDLTAAGATNVFTLASPALVPPNEYFLLARADAVGQATLMLSPEQWTQIGGSFALNGTSDTIGIRCNGTPIDSVSYDDAQVDTVVAAQSAQLDPRYFSASANDSIRNFCAPGTGIFDAYVFASSTPQFGTPGLPNTPCVDWTVGWCNLQFPTAPATGYASQTFTYYGRVFAPGLTDQSTANLANTRLAARVGRGTIGTDPLTDPSWSWSPMVPNPGYTAFPFFPESNNDEYWGELALPASPGGPFEVAVSFSGDGGNSWTLCDANGSVEGGYTSDQAGRITVLSSPPTPTAPGQVIFTEVMIDPQGTQAGEWLELHNPTGTVFNLNGCQLIEDTILTLGSVTIPSGGYITVGKGSSIGFTPTVVWPGLALGNTGGEDIELRCGGVTIDTFSVPATGELPGRSLQLPSHRIGQPNNNVTMLFGGNTILQHWCSTPRADNGSVRDTSYGSFEGNVLFGTPNAANAPCLAIDYCRLDAPTSLVEVPTGSLQVTNAQYFSQGGTDLTTGNEAHHMLRVEAGIGARDSDPAADPSAWTWVSGANIGGWDGSTVGEPNNDGFSAAIPAPATDNQVRDYAFRFSGDTGITWTYCDKVIGASNASADGYQVANAGKLSTPVSWTIDACSLNFPFNINDGGGTARVGDLRTIYGLLTINGLTDQTINPDTSGNVIVQFGYGADGSPRSGWTWAAAAPNAGYTSLFDDEYQYTLTIPSANGAPYDYGFRASGDGGATWTNCSGTGDLPVGTYNPQWGRIDSFSSAANVIPGQVATVSARSWHGFFTGAPAPNADVLAQVGFGDRGTNPSADASWSWQPLTYGGAAGNDWVWSGTVAVPNATPGSKSALVRFSGNGGASWLYADLVEPTWNPAGNTADEPAVTLVAPVAGDLVITEIMADPAQKTDAAGEWFEVHNGRSTALRVDGLLRVDSSAGAGSDPGFLIPSGTGLTIPAGGYAVFAIAAGALDTNSDGNPAPDYVFGSAVALGNTTDSITLTYAGTVVDTVAWSSALGFTIPTGRSLSLSNPSLDNTASANWCQATAAWDTGGTDFGTPRAANPACAAPPLAANSLVITEIYYAAPSGNGEWVELYNNSASTIDFAVNPIEIVDASPSVAGPINVGTVAPGAYFTIANSAVTGFTPNFVSASATWTGGFLADNADTVTIRNAGGGSAIDTVSYGAWGTAPASGRSLQLDVDATTGDNTLQANWCGGLADYDTSPTSQLGSPGSANHTCALDCNTGSDADFDGTTDCSEPACSGAPGCGAPPATPLLMFSEYIEGSSNNKAIEIWMARGSRSLSGCSVQFRPCNTGCGTATTTISLTATTLAEGEVFVVYNSGSAAGLTNAISSLPSTHKMSSGSASWNGDDSIRLVCDSVVLDTFGQWGVDPGSSWNVGGVQTVDRTLVRKCGQMPDTDDSSAFDPSAGWISNATDTFSFLGSHSCSPIP